MRRRSIRRDSKDGEREGVGRVRRGWRQGRGSAIGEGVEVSR